MTHVTYRLTTKNRDQLGTLRSAIEYWLPLLFLLLIIYVISEKKQSVTHFPHVTWKCTTLTCEVPNFLSDWRFACTCIFRTCVFHPCRFVLAFSVHAFSILAKCAVSYLPFPYLRFQRHRPSCCPTKSVKALKGKANSKTWNLHYFHLWRFQSFISSICVDLANSKICTNAADKTLKNL